MKKSEVDIGGGWVLKLNDTRWPFRNYKTDSKANFDPRNEELKKAFPVICTRNIFAYNGWIHSISK